MIALPYIHCPGDFLINVGQQQLKGVIADMFLELRAQVGTFNHATGYGPPHFHGKLSCLAIGVLHYDLRFEL